MRLRTRSTRMGDLIGGPRLTTRQVTALVLGLLLAVVLLPFGAQAAQVVSAIITDPGGNQATVDAQGNLHVADQAMDPSAPQLNTYFQTFHSDQFGNIDLTGILDIKNFNTVNLEIDNFPNPIPNLEVSVRMGKISGTTLSQEIDHFSLGPLLIRTYSVMGPDFTVTVMGAPPNTDVDIQAWVFLN
jgi:hypothetical protein